jgi:hypothetical protein
MTRFRVLLGKALVPTLAIVTAFIFGAVVIVLTDLQNLAYSGPILSQRSSAPSAASPGATGRCWPVRSAIRRGS